MQNHGQALKVAKTSELYRIPLATKSGYEAKECITWPEQQPQNKNEHVSSRNNGNKSCGMLAPRT
eukprot:9376433-Pyramimonas_sp.AAC.1